MTNTKLIQAKREKNDEFYTRWDDIHQEVRNYKEHFKGKVVYCNCDDPDWSEFYRYFEINFQALQLKKVITTHYESSGKASSAYIYDGNKWRQEKLPRTKDFLAGDFRSPDCIKYLEQADIVCTNPPFSLLRDFIFQLVKYKKKFLIIGNMSVVTYKETFPLIQNNEMWTGFKKWGKDMLFVPSKAFVKNKTNHRIVDGKVLARSQACWWTNLAHSKREQWMEFSEEYDPSAYIKYDNYNAIHITKVYLIPEDYYEEMGVPISYLEFHNPKQFEIVGADWQLPKTKLVNNKKDRFYLDGGRKFARLVIKRIKGRS